MSKLILDPPPTYVEEFNHIWRTWFSNFFKRVDTGPFLIRGYTVASAPSPAEWSDGTEYTSLIYVSDETGGATLAFSDGTNWRRVQDRAIIS